MKNSKVKTVFTVTSLINITIHLQRFTNIFFTKYSEMTGNIRERPCSRELLSTVKHRFFNTMISRKPLHFDAKSIGHFF